MRGLASLLNLIVMRMFRLARPSQRAAAAALLVLSFGSAERKWQAPRVVFSPAGVARLSEAVRMMTQIPAPPYWMPSLSEIESAEAAISKLPHSPSSDFGRQYFGFTIDGRRITQVRGFCKRYFAGTSDPEWERTPILLLDAGGCAFLADIDASSGDLLSFEWGTPGP